MTRILFLLACLSALASSSAWSQTSATPDIENESKKPAVMQSTQKSALEALADRLGLADEKATVTYEQVLADPDNVELNYAFARQQVRQGDLKGAAATLQRLLMVNPDLPKVRLFYAVVLYRLDDLTESQRELQVLKELNVSDDVKKELDHYLQAIAARLKRNHLSGQLGIGWEFDDNRNAAPASGRFLFQDTPLNASASSQRTSDTSLLFLAGVEGRHAFNGSNEAFGTFDYYRAEQTQLKLLNLQAYSVTAGDAIHTPWWGWTARPALLYDYVTLDQTTFLHNRGLDLRADRKLSGATGIFFDVRDVYNAYMNVPSFLTASDRTGVQIDVIGGVERILSPRQKIVADLDLGVKHAMNNVYAYNREALDVTHTLLFRKGVFLLSSFSLHLDQYPHPDVFVSTNHRNDETGRLSFTAGAPLTLIHPKLKDLLGTMTYEYYHAFSSITNYGYTNNKIAALLTYKWAAAF